MRGLIPLLAFLAIAGCVEDDGIAEAPAPEPPVMVERTDSVTETLDASWLAWGAACPPGSQPAVVFAGTFGEVDIATPANLTAVRLDLVWEALNPTAEILVFYVGGGSAAAVEGSSPLEYDIPGEVAAEMENGFSVRAEPASCPANAASFEGQTVEVKATLTWTEPLAPVADPV